MPDTMHLVDPCPMPEMWLTFKLDADALIEMRNRERGLPFAARRYDRRDA